MHEYQISTIRKVCAAYLVWDTPQAAALNFIVPADSARIHNIWNPSRIEYWSAKQYQDLGKLPFGRFELGERGATADGLSTED